MKNKKITGGFVSGALVAAAILIRPPASFAADYSHFGKASDDYKQQIYLSAVSEAQMQLKEIPNHAPSWILIARIYLTLNKCAEAGNAAASAYTIMDQPVALSADDTRDDLEKILTDLNTQCGPSLELARAYVQSKDYSKASEHYRGYLEKNAEDGATRLEFARALTWAKHYPEAAEQYKLYLHAHPEDTEAMLGLADVYGWSGDLHAAEFQFIKVLSREPNNVDVIVKLGRIYEWQGQSKSAIVEYDKALALSPGNEGARKGLDRIRDQASARQRQTSSAEIQRTIDQTGDRTLYLKLGDALYHNEGKVDEALVAYKRYLKEFPDDAAATLKVARVLSWEKHYDEAIPLYRDYLLKNPDDETAHLELANILTWQGRHTEALAELALIKQKNPALPGAYLAAGDILRWQTDYPGARDNYKKVLELNPDNARAQEGLREINAQWSGKPSVRAIGEDVAVSDIDFRRYSESLEGDFHVDDGRVDLTPGVKDYQFKQATHSLHAKEVYINGGSPIQNAWRWWGGLAGLQFADRGARLQGSLEVEGTISTTTWVRMGYTSEDAVFETNNLSALLNGMALRQDSYDLEAARTLPGDNEIQGLISAGFLTDNNSRTRFLVEALHQLDDAPIFKIGLAYKSLSYAHTSPLYWSPSSYSGPGVTAQLERKWDALSYKIGLKLYRITQTSMNEAAVDGGIYYRALNGFFGELTCGIGRGAGAAPQGTPNTQYKDILLSAGYKF